MSVRNLQYLFKPRSVALIGATERPRSVGAAVLRNLVTGPFSGTLWPVNPKYRELAGLKTYARVDCLPAAPDLAIICTPPATVPGLIGELGRIGTRAAAVLTAGFDAELRGQVLAAAKPHLLRVLGPNCVGLLVPGIGLNASFSDAAASPGKIAFVSQSGALVTAVLDWARSRGIGFSKIVSLGEAADVDLGDVIDYLASDGDTHAILLYVEAVTSARKFMSAARAAARNKPVLVVKAGRVFEGAKAATSHTGALAGADDVYDAAIRRAGMLRVFTTEDLFDAVETLARARPLVGERLCIVTNGGGPGVMATDALISGEGRLAELSEATLRALDGVLPSTWSRGNPVDIIGDATSDRYVRSLEILCTDPQADNVLLLHAPTAIVPSAEIASVLAPAIASAGRNVLTCWLGGDGPAQARVLFAKAGIATYSTPEDAVRAFLQLVQYRRNQQLLMEVPPSRFPESPHDFETASAVLRTALAAKRTMLSEAEAKSVLAAYGIPIVPTRTTATVTDAVKAATELGFPVALKICSPDISHKTDVGGVVLNVVDTEGVEVAAAQIERSVRKARPEARLEGFSVQPMVTRHNAHELIVGLAADPVFGPVVLFGHGGTATEVLRDRAIGLPPLNSVLARELVERTQIARVLAGYRDRPPANIAAITDVLVRVSHLVADLPQILELDINPLLADEHGVIALDARLKVSDLAPAGVDRFAIRPYPEELEEWVDWQGKRVLLRPIRPEDGHRHLEFFNRLDPEDIRLRMFMSLRELHPSQLARLTQIDYDREMAFIATSEREPGVFETLGVARAVTDPDNTTAEFAIIVRSDVKGRGLGPILFRKLVDYTRARGTGELVGDALAENARVISLANSFGFSVDRVDAGMVKLRLRLNPETAR
jgi:acetyltransferase